MEEEIIGSIKDVSGHTFDTIYDLFFTGQRMIAVLIQSPADVITVPSWTNIFIGGWGARRDEQRQLEDIAATRRRKCRNMSPEELVTKTQSHIVIRYEDISSIELRRYVLFSQYCLKIKLKSGDVRVRNFTLQRDQVAEARELLRKVLPGKYAGK